MSGRHLAKGERGDMGVLLRVGKSQGQIACWFCVGRFTVLRG
jgi:hypothetical protein